MPVWGLHGQFLDLVGDLLLGGGDGAAHVLEVVLELLEAAGPEQVGYLDLRVVPGLQGHGLVPDPPLGELLPFFLAHLALRGRPRDWCRLWSQRPRRQIVHWHPLAASGVRRHPGRFLLPQVVPLLPELLSLGGFPARHSGSLGGFSERLDLPARRGLARLGLPPVGILLRHRRVEEALAAVDLHIEVGLNHGGDLVALLGLPGAAPVHVQAWPPGDRRHPGEMEEG